MKKGEEEEEDEEGEEDEDIPFFVVSCKVSCPLQRFVTSEGLDVSEAHASNGPFEELCACFF